MRKLILIFCLTSISFVTQSQNFELGGTLGYGRTIFSENLNFKELFGSSTFDNCKVGFIFSLRPNITSLVFNSGILYQRKGNNEFSLNFLKIPIGLDVEPGKKVRFIIGFGFYLSYLFLTSGKVDKDILKSKSDFQQGAFVDVGIKYQIVSTWSIFCKFQLDSDWTTLYKESIPSHQGVEYQIMKSYEYSINLGLKYLIKSKRKNN